MPARCGAAEAARNAAGNVSLVSRLLAKSAFITSYNNLFFAQRSEELPSLHYGPWGVIISSNLFANRTIMLQPFIQKYDVVVGSCYFVQSRPSQQMECE